MQPFASCNLKDRDAGAMLVIWSRLLRDTGSR